MVFGENANSGHATEFFGITSQKKLKKMRFSAFLVFFAFYLVGRGQARPRRQILTDFAARIFQNWQTLVRNPEKTCFLSHKINHFWQTLPHFYRWRWNLSNFAEIYQNENPCLAGSITIALGCWVAEPPSAETIFIAPNTLTLLGTFPCFFGTAKRLRYVRRFESSSDLRYARSL